MKDSLKLCVRAGKQLLPELKSSVSKGHRNHAYLKTIQLQQKQQNVPV